MLWRHNDIIELIFQVISVIWDQKKFRCKTNKIGFILLIEVKTSIVVLQTVIEMQNEMTT